jgi:hypothetical protein
MQLLIRCEALRAGETRVNRNCSPNITSHKPGRLQDSQHLCPIHPTDVYHDRIGWFLSKKYLKPFIGYIPSNLLKRQRLILPALPE